MLVSVEAWPDEVVVRARGFPSARTPLAREFGETLAERIFDVEISVADDAGTAYSPTASARGGSGTMFRADWVFVPGPPEAARALVVRIDDPDTRIELNTDG